MAGLGGKNWSFQEEVTSSDVNGFLADQVVMRFADAATRTAGFGGAGEPTLAEGMVSYLDDVNRFEVYNGSVWVPIGFADGQQINTIESSASTTFTDLATVGPSVTVTTGTKAIVAISALTYKAAPGGSSIISFAISGATTRAASDDVGASTAIFLGNAGHQLARVQLVTGLTAGVNTFTMKYRNDVAVSFNWMRRDLVVWPLA